MMKTTEMTRGTMPAHSLDGTVLTVAGLKLDLDALQSPGQQVITIWAGPDGPTLDPTDRYLAVLTIPPRAYVAGTVTEEIDGETVEMETQIPQAVDPDAVSLDLWALEDEA
jgi:hypothetical protein